MSLKRIWNALCRRKVKGSTRGDGKQHGCWRVGDLAVCVGKQPWLFAHDSSPAPGPAPNSISRVVGVRFLNDWHLLELAEFPHLLCAARHFRKAQLSHSESCTEDFEQLLKRSRIAVPATLQAKP